ncbi:universal stress protein [Gillisia sp. M10.2A]|uniref:Universal stress protein n=1 Tax=Gillisia lutea TaxID=2909668 RepID=A0ABS9EIQ3_9FLAO|nr:universal stress protein [Gillisia lutea]MCF4102726.1 universal stress protein [Gillisia lutea]
MKKIVHTTDYSENSIAALKYAYKVSKILGYDLIVLHIHNHKNETASNLKLDVKEVIINENKRLKNFCSLHLKKDFDELQITAAVRKGTNVPSAIMKFIRDMNIHMLIMGARGAGNLKELLLGNNTTEMLDLSPFPVLTVPADFEFSGIQKILYTTDFEKKDACNILELTKILAPMDISILLVHISTEDEAATKQKLEKFQEVLEEKIPGNKIQSKLIYSNTVFESLVTFINEYQPEMLVMYNRKRKNNLTGLLHRDFVKRMYANIKTPLLSFKETCY